jgi:8-oxo-dGTP diphosphatase
MHEYVYPNGDHCQYLSVWFRCRAVGGTARPDGEESLEVAWFAPDALPEGLEERILLRIETTASADARAWYPPPQAQN